MYRTTSPGQLSFENFYLPFGGKLSGDNRWVKLAELIPWETVEADYAEQFSDSMGAPAKSFRVALGALIIKEKLGTINMLSFAEGVETQQQLEILRKLGCQIGQGYLFGRPVPFEEAQQVLLENYHRPSGRPQRAAAVTPSEC